VVDRPACASGYRQSPAPRCRRAVGGAPTAAACSRHRWRASTTGARACSGLPADNVFQAADQPAPGRRTLAAAEVMADRRRHRSRPFADRVSGRHLRLGDEVAPFKAASTTSPGNGRRSRARSRLLETRSYSQRRRAAGADPDSATFGPRATRGRRGQAVVSVPARDAVIRLRPA
jgi:hypothetical protein